MNNNSIDLVQQYIDTEYDGAKQRKNEVEILRRKFISDFPVDEIINMSLDDYVIAAKEYVKDGSFCYRLKFELDELASMGDLRSNIFGVYKKGYEIKLSPGLVKKFGNDYIAAFVYIKQEIVNVLKATEKRDYNFVENSKLTKPFVMRLMMVYYPGSVFNACTKNALEKYCDIVGIGYSSKDTYIQKSNALLEWRDKYLDSNLWDNYLFMAMLDWLRRKKLSINGDELDLYNPVYNAKIIDEEMTSLIIDGKSKEAIVKVRVNQGIFRDRLLSRYSKCCLCNVNNPQLLIASHIKPWSECEDSEKLLVDNGFLLCPNHDSLFDKGLISFNDDGTIIISDKLDETNRLFMNVNIDMRIKVYEGNVPFLKYHRERLYEG